MKTKIKTLAAILAVGATAGMASLATINAHAKARSSAAPKSNLTSLASTNTASTNAVSRSEFYSEAITSDVPTSTTSDTSSYSFTTSSYEPVAVAAESVSASESYQPLGDAPQEDGNTHDASRIASVEPIDFYGFKVVKVTADLSDPSVATNQYFIQHRDSLTEGDWITDNGIISSENLEKTFLHQPPQHFYRLVRRGD